MLQPNCLSEGTRHFNVQCKMHATGNVQNVRGPRWVKNPRTNTKFVPRSYKLNEVTVREGELREIKKATTVGRSIDRSIGECFGEWRRSLASRAVCLV